MYVPKTQLGSDVEKMRLQHPGNISEQEMRNHLQSLRFEELSLLGKKKFVFDPQQVDEIARTLTKAINHARPDKVVHYELETPAGTTSMEVFISQDKINWKIISIRGVEFESTSFVGSRGSSWRMVLLPGQRYFVSSGLLGKSTEENWIVADLSLPKTVIRKKPGSRPSTTQSPPQKTPPGPSSGQGTSPELEKKLQFLKDLREKQLIDDSEYERKRKELLDSYL